MRRTSAALAAGVLVALALGACGEKRGASTGTAGGTATSERTTTTP